MSRDKWEDDSIQFPRLLCEIMATQDKLDIPALAESMDLSVEDVNELFDRAHTTWERAKKQNEILAFQSGRMYTEKGQRIAATLTPEGGILFADVDRMIDGYIHSDHVAIYSLTLCKEDVMWAYDNHEKTQYWIGVLERDEQLKPLKEAARALPAPARR